MKTPIVLLAADAASLVAARLPRMLDRAGFAVSLLTPANALAEHSRHIARIGHLPDAATPAQWLYGFAAMVRATAPRIVVPCDDISLSRLRMLVLAPPEGMQATLQAELVALVRESLGDPTGVAIAVPAAAAAASAGTTAAYTRVAVAWRGRELAGVTRVHLAPDAPLAPVPAVARYSGDPEVRARTQQAIAESGLSGFAAIGFTYDPVTGIWSPPVIRHHPTSDTHMAALAGIDLAAALHAALAGAGSGGPDDLAPGQEHVVAAFPEEWLRDAHSRHLQDCPVDAPWDEPDLFAAMLALPRERQNA